MGEEAIKDIPTVDPKDVPKMEGDAQSGEKQPYVVYLDESKVEKVEEMKMSQRREKQVLYISAFVLTACLIVFAYAYWNDSKIKL